MSALESPLGGRSSGGLSARLGALAGVLVAGLVIALAGLLLAVSAPSFPALGAAVAVDDQIERTGPVGSPHAPSAGTAMGDGPAPGARLGVSEGEPAPAQAGSVPAYTRKVVPRTSRDRARAAAIAADHAELRTDLVLRRSDDVLRTEQALRKAGRDATLQTTVQARQSSARAALDARIAAEQKVRLAAIEAEARVAAGLPADPADVSGPAAVGASPATTVPTGSSYDLPADYTGIPDSGSAASPITGGVVGARFGQTGLWATYHTGLDYRAAYGTPIHAAADGVVVYAGNDNTWSGNHVAVRHADGSTTMYSHMSSIDARPGEQVRAGDVLGLVGDTGRAFGAHLHFEVYPPGVRYGDVYKAVDPVPWLQARGIGVS